LRLSRSKARTEAAKLRNWKLKGNVIVTQLRFADFAKAMQFVNKVARLAEAANHHPDITINYNKVKLVLTTHDEGGLTVKDFKLARKINRTSE